jgi:hypothetical protein
MILGVSFPRNLPLLDFHHFSAMSTKIKLLIGFLILLGAVSLSYTLFRNSLSFKTSKELGIKYKTVPALILPSDTKWESVEFAKELLNIKDKIVVLGGGANPISSNDWKNFQVSFPWFKNKDRHILFSKTAFIKSPNTSFNCKGDDCYEEIDYQGYTWLELAKPLAVDFIPSETSITPEKGHLTVKVIQKCQAIIFENEIYELSDNKGNKYAMHATESGTPNLNVILPEGFKIEKIILDKPLIIVPFGEKGDCYFNIVGDHLGQGYHQYKYANDYYP